MSEYGLWRIMFEGQRWCDSNADWFSFFLSLSLLNSFSHHWILTLSHFMMMLDSSALLIQSTTNERLWWLVFHPLESWVKELPHTKEKPGRKKKFPFFNSSIDIWMMISNTIFSSLSVTSFSFYISFYLQLLLSLCIFFSIPWLSSLISLIIVERMSWYNRITLIQFFNYLFPNLSFPPFFSLWKYVLKVLFF